MADETKNEFKSAALECPEPWAKRFSELALSLKGDRSGYKRYMALRCSMAWA